MPAVPFKVKAVYEYRSEEPDDLSFDNGQIITVIEEDDPDWYTGEYVNPVGEKREGIFPRNFVEKYEPAIPSRPVRAPKRAPAPEPSEPVPQPLPPQPATPALEPTEAVHEENTEPPTQKRAEPEDPPPAPKPQPTAPAATATSVPSPKAPPPVAEKPSSNSFRDRIAAFNKPAAAPVAPFKPSGGPTTGFIKKPFVAPPPSRNAYVPPPREAPVQKPYRREEDTSVNESESREPLEAAAPLPEPEAEDQPKPVSLKERIALLQKQQSEQAARNAEKKEKPKKPPKKRVETTESSEQAPPVAPALTRLDSNDTLGRPSTELAEGEHEPSPAPLPRRTTGLGAPQSQPLRELVSDTNDADDSGVGDEDDVPEISTEEERPKSQGQDLPSPAAASRKSTEAEQRDDAEDEGEEEEEDEEDAEDRRKRELRERMAKMSGGMGMMGMFGPPGGGGLPGTGRKPKTSSEGPRQSTESHGQDESQPRAAPVPIMALPGMAQSLPKRQEEPVASSDSEEDVTEQPTPQTPSAPVVPDDYIAPQPLQRRSTDRRAPPVPQDRTVPPTPPRGDTRAAPPPPPSGPRAAPPVPQSPTSRVVPPPPGSLPQAAPETSGYEQSDESMEEETGYQPSQTPASPTGIPPVPPYRQADPPRLDTTEESIYPPSEKRRSTLPPPIPISPASPMTRAPPPPPPGAPPSRRSTADSGLFGTVHSPRPNLDEGMAGSEYEADYDTDMASDVKHRDALKAHNRDSSLDEGTLTDDVKSPKSPPARAAPPLPPVGIPQNIPPPPPSIPAPKTRKSVDVPRVAPPPVPPPKIPESKDYDPYNHSAPQHAPPKPFARAPYSANLQSPKEEIEQDEMYDGDSPYFPPPPPSERTAPPPPQGEPAAYKPLASLAPPQPADGSPEPPTGIKRQPSTRRSMDNSRGSEHGFIASDVDLGKNSLWWTQKNVPPPSLQGRPDILYEMETNSSVEHGGRTIISKDVNVLYMDYSQTLINAEYDSAEPSRVKLDQTQERPPTTPRRDQLENASEQYGKQIARVANGLAGTTVADGSARGFVLELLKPHTTALFPVGTRAYGALVYANLGNASTQQFDEIRPGDIVTFRNSKFSGHKGSLHQKYSFDVGKPEHVAVVIDWDGTKKKIRAWEQGRDLEKGKKPKVREESFKVGDLRSGEVMVWRVMPRTWVGWANPKS